MRTLWERLLAEERGQDLLEYAFLTAAIGFAGIAAWDAVRAAIGNAYGVWEGEVNNLWIPPDPAGS